MKLLIYSICFFLSITVSYAQVDIIEGSHYVLPDFSKGIVLMKSGKKYNYSLNYNSFTEEMIFTDTGKPLAIGSSEISRIDTIYIDERKFVPLNEKFVELIYHSTCELYVEYKCNVIFPGKPAGYGGTTQTGAVSAYRPLNPGSVIYRLRLPEEYEIKPYNFYWLRRNGELNRFVNLKQLQKMYKDKKAIFKDYNKNNHVKYIDQDSIVRLIEYLDMH